MKLLVVETQKEFEAEIHEVTDEDLKRIRDSKQFQFDWAKEREGENYVFKITRASEEASQEIFGLLSITNMPEEFRIHVNLIENSNENKGEKKKVDRIAGCLLAFSAQISFEKGYSGFVSLVPKTKLIGLYVNKYGFSQYGRQLAIEGKAAIHLIQKYL